MHRKMNFVGIGPKLYTLNILINCCCHLNNLNCGFGVFGEILKRGFQPDLVTVGTLVKGMCMVGEVMNAVKVFDKMSEKGCLRGGVHVWYSY